MSSVSPSIVHIMVRRRRLVLSLMRSFSLGDTRLSDCLIEVNPLNVIDVHAILRIYSAFVAFAQPVLSETLESPLPDKLLFHIVLTAMGCASDHNYRSQLLRTLRSQFVSLDVVCQFGLIDLLAVRFTLASPILLIRVPSSHVRMGCVARCGETIAGPGSRLAVKVASCSSALRSRRLLLFLFRRVHFKAHLSLFL